MTREKEEHEALTTFMAEMKLRLHENQYKSSWRENRIGTPFLLEKLESHLRRYRASTCASESIDEMTDVANFAMMLADIDRREGTRCGECPECKKRLRDGSWSSKVLSTTEDET